MISENVAGVSAAILFRRCLLGVPGAKQMAGWICVSELWRQEVLGDQGAFWV
jgi:hypothetical protein